MKKKVIILIFILLIIAVIFLSINKNTEINQIPFTENTKFSANTTASGLIKDATDEDTLQHNTEYLQELIDTTSSSGRRDCTYSFWNILFCVVRI